MKEIGSEFWTEIHNGSGIKSLFTKWDRTVLTLCGRTALELIVEDIINYFHIKSVYMPSYCCHTMIEPFVKQGISIVFYNVVATKDGIKCEYESNDCDVVFLIDYFGFCDPETKAFAEREHHNGKLIIYDATHSLFNKNTFCYADYFFGSFRKWFGLNAGFASKSLLWKHELVLHENESYCDLRNLAFDLKAKYIATDEADLKPVFLDMFRNAEEMLERDYHYYLPDRRSIQSLESIDVISLKKRRKNNAEFLIDALKGLKDVILPYQDVGINDCPLFIPICVDNRDGLRRFLIYNNVYCPAHWPVSQFHILNDTSRMLYDSELSIICDQRYSLDDMKVIVNCICEYYK